MRAAEVTSSNLFSLSRNQTLVLLLFIIIKRVRHLHANLLVQQGGDVALAARVFTRLRTGRLIFCLCLSLHVGLKQLSFGTSGAAKS